MSEILEGCEILESWVKLGKVESKRLVEDEAAMAENAKWKRITVYERAAMKVATGKTPSFLNRGRKGFKQLFLL